MELLLLVHILLGTASVITSFIALVFSFTNTNIVSKLVYKIYVLTGFTTATGVALMITNINSGELVSYCLRFAIYILFIGFTVSVLNFREKLVGENS